MARAPGTSHVVGAGTTGAGSGEQREAGCRDTGVRGSVGLGGPAAGGRARPAQGRWAGAGGGPPWRSSWKILLRRPPLGPAFGQAGRQWVVGLGARAASPFVPRPQLPPTPFPGLRGSEARVPLPGRRRPGRPGGVPSPLSPLDSGSDSCPAGLGQAPRVGLRRMCQASNSSLCILFSLRPRRCRRPWMRRGLKRPSSSEAGEGLEGLVLGSCLLSGATADSEWLAHGHPPTRGVPTCRGGALRPSS